MIHHYNTRNADGPHRVGAKSEIVNKSLLIQAPKYWLIFPNEIKNSNNIKLFTKRLKRYLINT